MRPMRGSSPALAGRRGKAASAVLLLGLFLLTAFTSPALAADTTPPSVTRLAMSPSHFSPNGDGKSDVTSLRFTVSEAGRVTVRVLSPITGKVLRTLASNHTVASGSQSIVWNGKDDGGSRVADGRYTVRVYVKDRAGNVAHPYPCSLSVWVDTVKPTFASVWASPSPFSPNHDGRRETTAIRVTLSEAGYVNASISGQGHTRSWTTLYRPTGTSGIVWNGHDQSGVRVDDGAYVATVRYRDLAGNEAVVPARTGRVVVDTTPPAVTGATLSPYVATPYDKDGIDDTAGIRYSVDETSSFAYTVRNPFGVKLRGGGTSGLIPGPHVTRWDARQRLGTYSVIVPNGRYPILMSFTDVAGNRVSIRKAFVIHSYYLVTVDPGHGGKNGVYDSGAVGPTGLRESVVNFDVAYNRLRPMLGQVPTATVNGYRIAVLMTRTKEYDPSMTLDRRSSLANYRGANMFVSIHANSAMIASAGGTETFYYDDGGARGNQSARLAQLIYGKVMRRTDAYNLSHRGVKEEGFYVLRHTRMAAALHEMAFISNRREERLLRNSTFKNRVAMGIRDGIVAYLQSYP